MKFYKQTTDGYISAIGTGGGIEITETEYNKIKTVIRNRPEETPTTGYRLREDLTWEACEVDPPDPDPEIDDAEVYAILFGGAE